MSYTGNFRTPINHDTPLANSTDDEGLRERIIKKGAAIEQIGERPILIGWGFPRGNEQLIVYGDLAYQLITSGEREVIASSPYAPRHKSRIDRLTKSDICSYITLRHLRGLQYHVELCRALSVWEKWSLIPLETLESIPLSSKRDLIRIAYVTAHLYTNRRHPHSPWMRCVIPNEAIEHIAPRVRRYVNRHLSPIAETYQRLVDYEIARNFQITDHSFQLDIRERSEKANENIPFSVSRWMRSLARIWAEDPELAWAASHLDMAATRRATDIHRYAMYMAALELTITQAHTDKSCYMKHRSQQWQRRLHLLEGKDLTISLLAQQMDAPISMTRQALFRLVRGPYRWPPNWPSLERDLPSVREQPAPERVTPLPLQERASEERLAEAGELFLSGDELRDLIGENGGTLDVWMKQLEGVRKIDGILYVLAMTPLAVKQIEKGGNNVIIQYILSQHEMPICYAYAQALYQRKSSANES